ncbi:recombinase family protein [Paenarthrobacter sp. NPDC058040]|uniref:recombinase family protein n=1 Tax=unclassified Paenarthrobacter TaxID=2634190 RepID=UPI0036D97B00
MSLADQNSDLQLRGLEAAGFERKYQDRGVSGTRVKRPELDKLLDRPGRGDEVVVWKLDRLGRSTRHLLELLDDFKARGIKFSSPRDGIATDPDSEVGGAMAQAMVTIISAFAQLERDQLSERTRAGMAVAAANGRKAGRRQVTSDDRKVKRAKELKARGLPPADIGKIIGASRRPYTDIWVWRLRSRRQGCFWPLGMPYTEELMDDSGRNASSRLGEQRMRSSVNNADLQDLQESKRGNSGSRVQSVRVFSSDGMMSPRCM